MGDLVLGGILVLAILDGWHRGIIKVLGSIGAVVGGIFIARRITPFILPWLETTFSWTGEANPLFEELTTLFFSQSPFGRLLELVILVLTIALVTWLLRMFTNWIGNIINATPLVGFISRFLGAVLSVIGWAVILYALHIWIFPWLISIFPAIAPINKIFTTSAYILPYITEIGYWAWFLAAAGLNTLQTTGTI